MNRYQRTYLLVKELGLSQLVPYALYRTQLRSGSFVKKFAPPCPVLVDPCAALSHAYLFEPSKPLTQISETEILNTADKIVAGIFHPFSGDPAPLDLGLPASSLEHWSNYGNQLNGLDIKTIWEPARFSWAIPLCQANQIHPFGKYARTFWKNMDIYWTANPEGQGPNWSSAQEVALRLVPWLLAAQTFQNSPESTTARIKRFVQVIWQQNHRIALTLNYSRSQNNNHLLSEALGLMIGGLVFRETVTGKKWLRQGFNEFQKGILCQIEPDGTYSQHSSNYHRLMLHLALLFKIASQKAGFSPSTKVRQRLAKATSWMIAQMDETTGYLPNLGHNDGSNLLPMGCIDYLDYRPTVQAASRSFLGSPYLPAGPWDELSNWLGLSAAHEETLNSAQLGSKAIQRIGNTHTWATLRALQFHSRPAHTDLLTIDIWHDGVNLLTDAGTYAYNLADPWQNALAGTAVHNTVMVNGQDQMIRSGKFLWLERARAFPLPRQPDSLAAILYCNLSTAYTQVRRLTFRPGQGFEMLDQIDLARPEKTPLPVTIQFLLPDWEWSLEGGSLTIKNHGITFTVVVNGVDPAGRTTPPGTVSLIRAGEPLVGEGANPIRGWISHTYLEKKPGLSFSMTFLTKKSLEINTKLIL